jgi:excisionase family DNA binding protein
MCFRKTLPESPALPPSGIPDCESSHTEAVMANQGRVELLTTGDAARILGLDPATVRLYERTGRLAAHRTRRGLRLFERADVERLAARREELVGRRGGRRKWRPAPEGAA